MIREDLLPTINNYLVTIIKNLLLTVNNYRISINKFSIFTINYHLIGSMLIILILIFPHRAARTGGLYGRGLNN